MTIAQRENGAAMLEKVVVGGDLSKLSAAERLAFYQQTCESLGLNPLTRPFEYITLNGRLTLYARRDATDQLRRLNGISIRIVRRDIEDGVYVVEASATDKTGRTDTSIGAVPIDGLKGEAKANALMKAETKAKRRVTLSICGLGMLDETEVESFAGPQAALEDPKPAVPEGTSGAHSDLASADVLTDAQKRTIWALGKTLGAPADKDGFKAWLSERTGLEVVSLSEMTRPFASRVIDSLKRLEAQQAAR